MIEAVTYRYRGHFEGDHQPYREDSDIDEWRAERDPIETFKERLMERDELTESEFEEMQDEIADQIAEAIEFAQEADYPDPHLAYEDVYSEQVPEIDHFADRLRTDGEGGDRQ
jgi:pyruvate dehydrogenase E1 component alpha subunit